MNQQEAYELNELFFDFVGLFHEKFMARFHRSDNILPGLKKNHLKILGYLSKHEYLISTEISHLLDIEKGSITTLVDQLVEKGLVIRRGDLDDRRKMQILLSGAGREAMDVVTDRHSRELRDILSNVEIQEIVKFIECLRFSVDFMNKL